MSPGEPPTAHSGVDVAVPTGDTPVKVPDRRSGQLVALGVLVCICLIACLAGGLVLIGLAGRFLNGCLPELL